MKRISILFIFGVIILIMGIFSIITSLFIFKGTNFVFLELTFSFFYLLCVSVSVFFYHIRKKSGMEVLATDLEPERLLNNMSKWSFLYSPYERNILTFLSYQALFRYDLALDTLNKNRKDITKYDCYSSFSEASDYCRCYIALNNKEQADIYLNYCREAIKNLQLNQQKQIAYFTMELLERSYAMHFDNSYADFDYYERLLNPNSGLAPINFYSNYNVVVIRYNLGKLYLRTGMFDRANFNFKYVADNGKNLPIANRARNYLMYGITKDL
ncbi:MAG: hypothetical protein UIM53_07465 [Acutalibacteraceae bacterium]|nr:hypothetical protein [Acutalibacteraceae bacterium]